MKKYNGVAQHATTKLALEAEGNFPGKIQGQDCQNHKDWRFQENRIQRAIREVFETGKPCLWILQEHSNQDDFCQRNMGA